MKGHALIASCVVALVACGGDSTNPTGGGGGAPGSGGGSTSSTDASSSEASSTSASSTHTSTSASSAATGGGGASAGGGGAGGDASGGGGAGGDASGGGGAGGEASGGGGAGGDATGGGGSGGGVALQDPLAIVYAGTGVGVDAREPVTATFAGDALTGYRFSDNERPGIGTATAFDRYAAAGASGSLALVGRWGDGLLDGKFYGATLDLPKDGGFLYIVGSMTTNLAGTSTSSYVLEHAAPVIISDGSLAPGTGTAAIALSGAGDATKVGAEITLTLPGDQTYVVKTTGGVTTPSTAETSIFPAGKATFGGIVPVAGTTGACTGISTCRASIFGFFAGSSAEKAALVVHIYNNAGGSPKTVSGGFVFRTP